MPLRDMIPTEQGLSDDMVKKWNSVLPVLLDKHVVNTITIEGNVGYKYKHDMEGLLLSIDVPRELLYPHMAVNGVPSSSSYNGDAMSVKILDNSVLFNYLELFTI